MKRLSSIFCAVALALASCESVTSFIQSDAGRATISALEQFAIQAAMSYFGGGGISVGSRKLTKRTASPAVAQEAVIEDAQRRFPTLSRSQIAPVVHAKFREASAHSP